jgi:hypothetical protein
VGQAFQRDYSLGFEARQIIGNHGPNDAGIDLVVSVVQSITHAPEIDPMLLRRQARGLVSKADYGLANPFQASLDGIVPKVVCL